MLRIAIASLGLAFLLFLNSHAADSAAQGPNAPLASTATESLEEVVVTGSRIPRTAVDGPAPVVTITAQDITNNGFATAAEIMSSLTQNLGALDNNQNTDGFSPGAQAVDLRGLGPNHTLVLVNGRRIADYPQSYQGNSNFTDISNIPAALIDRVEILSGSASAVYGSDAISGVINFILKQHADGTTVDFRAGATQHGGGASQRFQLTSGFSTDRLEALFGIELFNQNPLWAYQRDYTNSRLDSPADPSRIAASPVFVRMDVDENYLDPGEATCNALSSYDRGSVGYDYRRNYGYFCGSYRDVGYGTLENGRKAVNLYGTATYKINDSVSAFLDIQAGYSHQISYNTPLEWENSYQLNGDSTPVPFFNQATGQIEQWQRRYFTIEENGGFKNGEIQNNDTTLSLNTGIKGTLVDTSWSYEAVFGHSQNRLLSKWPALVSAKAQALYLGPSLGVDPDSGYQIYNAPISRLYTPLTPAEFASITNLSLDHDKSRSENISFSVNNPKLWELPGGPVGFAAVAEWGTQSYTLDVDPLSLDGSYFGLHNTGADGSRTHEGAGAEISVPVFKQLTVNAAGRIDNYKYSDTSTGKFTYSAGVEYRPFQSLLIRGSYSTGFRAPDLSYLYAGVSGSSSSGTDYYLCRRDEPETGPDFADNCSNGDVSFNGRSKGSTALKDETSVSQTYGVVFAPFNTLKLSVDYYRIVLRNEVEYQESDTILREEADCRLGGDINSALCQQVLSQVVRNPATALSNPEGITSVFVLPINAAIDATSGVDFAAHYVLPTTYLGTFGLEVGYTEVLTHTTQFSTTDAQINELNDWYDYVIPRNKASFTVSWNYGPVTTTLHGNRLGGLPNYDGTQRLGSTSIYNASVNYHINERATATLIVDNLFDREPYRDSTWTSYPYYSSRWFSPVGRELFLEFNYHFGGHGG
jgi:outer membrane receptor protein involved in Fe transport